MSSSLASFLGAVAMQAVTYVALTGSLLALTRRWAAGWFARRRIAVRGRAADRAQVAHELRHSLVAITVGGAQAAIVQAMHAAGVDRLVEQVDGPMVAVAWLAGLIAWNDLWFYGVHRALHTPWLYRHVHAVHHRSVDVTPMSSYAFHGVEALLVTGWILPAALLAPIPLPVLGAAQALGLFNNVMSHLGFELLPAWWTRAPILGWTNTATFHSLHHQKFRGNYGLFPRVWDRLFGTEVDGYEAAFEAATGASEPASVR